ncbi:MAG: hypothetical protein V2B18_21170 [Pseudomonadota bacterium]
MSKTPPANLRLEWLDPMTLKPNPSNFRRHPEQQKKVLAAMITEVGWAGALLLNESTGHLIDGHARQEDAVARNEAAIPVLVGAWSLADERKILATLDPIAAMAEQADDIYRELMEGVETESEDLRAWCDGVIESMQPQNPATKSDTAEKPSIIKSASLDDIPPTSQEMEVLQHKQFLVEYSGGKDSSAATLWLKHYFPQASVTLLFVDMGADFPGFQLFNHVFSEFIDYPLQVLRTPISQIELMLQKGDWPMFVHPYCHGILHDALDVYVQGYSSEDIVVVRGGRVSEKAGRSKARKTRFMEIDRLPGYRYFQPLYFSDKDSSEVIIRETQAPLWDGYLHGLQRTACRICPGQKPGAYAAIRANYSDTWSELMELERRFGPGCWWQNEDKTGRGDFASMADRGQAKFEEGSYRGR